MDIGFRAIRPVVVHCAEVLESHGTMLNSKCCDIVDHGVFCNIILLNLFTGNFGTQLAESVTTFPERGNAQWDGRRRDKGKKT